MSKYNDKKYIGFISDKLTVIDFKYNENNEFRWVCRCSCGKGEPKMYPPSKVYLGKVKSCGCNTINKRGQKYNSDEYIGKIYSGLKIIGLGSPQGRYDGTIWKCECMACNRICEFPAKHVVSGRYTSCSDVKCRRALKINKAKYNDSKYIGEIFGKLRVESIHYKKEHNTTSVFWKCRCILCGNYCEFPAHSIVSGNNKTCGCTKSLVENYIKEIFDKYNITYKQEVSFEGLVGINGGKLRFDFALIDRKGNTKLLEYDGSHHDVFSLTTKTSWDITKVLEHDRIKNEYCNNHNIELIRMSERFNNPQEVENYLIENNII